MDEVEQAHHELGRLQGIISRHEGHMFALRGWLLAIVGGLLAAYYTENIFMDELLLQISLFVVVLLFLVVETRHVNLVEAVVERVADVERQIAASRLPDGGHKTGWYDGPKVNDACQEGAHRRWPRRGMTFVLNQPFYLVVILVILLATITLPAKLENGQPQSGTPEQVKRQSILTALL